MSCNLYFLRNLFNIYIWDRIHWDQIYRDRIYRSPAFSISLLVTEVIFAHLETLTRPTILLSTIHDQIIAPSPSAAFGLVDGVGPSSTSSSFSPHIRFVKKCARLATEDNMLHILFNVYSSPFPPQTLAS